MGKLKLSRYSVLRLVARVLLTARLCSGSTVVVSLESECKARLDDQVN